MRLNPGRRRALALGAGMVSVAVLAALGKPVAERPEGAPAPRLDEVFPREFGDWRIDEASKAFVRPPDQLGRLYGIYDQVLERSYIDPQGRRVMLSVAFGSEQSAGLKMHRPEVCYAVGGYEVSGLRRGETLALAGRAVPVTRLHALRPGRSEPITYWTVLGDVVVPDRVGFALRQLSFGLRRRLLDGMLVRVSSIDADPAEAYDLQARFAQALAAALKPADRPKVIGRAAAE